MRQFNDDYQFYMKRIIIPILLITSSLVTFSQTLDSVYQRQNSAQTLINSKDGNLLMAAYGEVHYNQPFSDDTRQNASLDVHRQVLLFGYRFNRKTTFISEIEIEHIKEVFLEQAFMNYEATPRLNVQAGLLLIPMGIVNEYHEPTTFNGVERPTVDNYLIPSTWREIGAGVAGNLPQSGLRYQLYVVNGPLGFDEEGTLSGKKPIRGARQKGAQVTMTSPDIAGRLTYYGIKGLNAAVSFYAGNTESSLYDNLATTDAPANARADSSIVGFKMATTDFRYQHKAFESRGQITYAMLDNVDRYNGLTGSDLGIESYGYYVEAGYNIGSLWKGKKLVPFIRYSQLNTHHKIPASINTPNLQYRQNIMTTGFTYFIHPSMVFKVDYQNFERGDGHITHQINSGIGFWFR